MSRRFAAPHLAGWLFADVLLVLLLAALASLPAASAEPSDSSSGRPSPTLPSASPEPSKPPVLDLEEHTLVIPVDYNGLLSGGDGARAARALVDRFNQELRRQRLNHRTAGLVLAFGTTPTSKGVGPEVALRANVLIKQRVAGFGRVHWPATYWRAGSNQEIQFIVYFFTQ